MIFDEANFTPTCSCGKADRLIKPTARTVRGMEPSHFHFPDSQSVFPANRLH
jgi:hypothetical protein